MEISKISALHYLKLLFRGLLFFLALYCYIFHLFQGTDNMFGIHPLIILVIWLIFMTEMAFRFFPSKMESMGCQKQFAKNDIPTGKSLAPEDKQKQNKGVALIAVLWLLLNGVIGICYFLGFWGAEILFLIRAYLKTNSL